MVGLCSIFRKRLHESERFRRILRQSLGRHELIFNWTASPEARPEISAEDEVTEATVVRLTCDCIGLGSFARPLLFLLPASFFLNYPRRRLSRHLEWCVDFRAAVDERLRPLAVAQRQD
jgi:hypothetical protein